MSKSEKLVNLDTLICGDVMDVLRAMPSDSIDICITSPPYNKNKRSRGWLVKDVKYSHFDDKMNEDDYQQWQIEVINEVYRITKPGGHFFYNHKLRWFDGIMIHPYSWVMRSPWVIKQEIIWDRSIAANVRGWRFWQIDERIYWLRKPSGRDLNGPELESRHAKMSSIWRIPPAPRLDDHPAPFPIDIPTRIITSIYPEGKKIVLDPFMGTGTTAVASKLLGHHYIGIDISPDYVKFAEERIENCENERSKIKKELDKHVVNKSFKDRKKLGKTKWPFGPQNRISPEDKIPPAAD